MHLPVINCMIESVTQNKKGEIVVNLVGMGFNWKLILSDDVDSTAIELKKVGHAIVDFENSVEAQHIEWTDKTTKADREMSFVNVNCVPRGFISFTADQKISSEMYAVLSKFPVLKHRAASSSQTSSIPSDKK